MLKTGIIVVLIMILVCAPSMQYTYAQPEQEAEQPEMISNETEEEDQREQQLEEMQEENNRMDQQSMEQLNDNS